jgi:hypothetical protein
VSVELGGKPDQSAWVYMQDPDNWLRSQDMNDPGYALNLTTEEMQDPVTVYKMRLAKADNKSEELKEDTKRYLEWGKRIEHFVSVHKMAPAVFRKIKENVDNGLKYFPVQQEVLVQIKLALQRKLDYYSTDDGKRDLSELAKEAANGYFKQKDAEIKDRRARLENLLRGKTAASFEPPPVVGQLTWDQFFKLVKKDKEDCPFGGLK